MTIAIENVTDTVIELLERATQKRCGDSTSPQNEDGSFVEPPYTILYTIAGGSFSGPMYFQPEADVTLMYQVTSVGVTRKQAQWLATKVREAITGRDQFGRFVHVMFPPDGVIVMDRRSEGALGGVERESSVYVAHDTYTVETTPA